VKRRARNGQALLSPDDVRQIRSMLQGGMTCTAIGRAFGVALETVFQIKTNKNWGWLP
jgi:transposase-like protein